MTFSQRLKNPHTLYYLPVSAVDADGGTDEKLCGNVLMR